MGTSSRHHQDGTENETSSHDCGGAFRLLLAANPLPMWVYDIETLRFVEVNDAAVARYGYSRDEFLAMSIADIRPEEDEPRLRLSVDERKDVLQHSGTWRHRRSDGTTLEVEITSHLLDWEGHPAALVVAYDVTETRHLQATLSRRALYDDATGLVNAALFLDRTAAAIERPAGTEHIGVVVVALSALEDVVATMGDAVGDAVVAEVARRLRACCSNEETLARLGGGHFGILCESGDRHAVLRLTASVLAALEVPVVAGSAELRVAPVAGVAFDENRGSDAAGFVREATIAMRHAAERGGGFVVANSELRRSLLEAFETEQALRGATDSGQLHLVYQPVVDLGADQVVACEALVRWTRPRIGLVGPDAFIPLAERSGLILEVGAFVINQAINEAATWSTVAQGRPKVAVNLSARQLHDEQLVRRFTAACSNSGLSPEAVTVELTESAFVASDDYGAYETLRSLRDLGIEVAIDDFGTGYSALSYLKHLPVDAVKVDRGFVAGLGVDPVDTLLVEAVVHVAHGLGLRVVAEGVETAAQLEELRQLGCDAAQGYLFARPVAGAELPAALDAATRAVAR